MFTNVEVRVVDLFCHIQSEKISTFLDSALAKNFRCKVQENIPCRTSCRWQLKALTSSDHFNDFCFAAKWLVAKEGGYHCQTGQWFKQYYDLFIQKLYKFSSPFFSTFSDWESVAMNKGQTMLGRFWPELHNFNHISACHWKRTQCMLAKCEG